MADKIFPKFSLENFYHWHKYGLLFSLKWQACLHILVKMPDILIWLTVICQVYHWAKMVFPEKKGLVHFATQVLFCKLLYSGMEQKCFIVYFPLSRIKKTCHQGSRFNKNTTASLRTFLSKTDFYKTESVWWCRILWLLCGVRCQGLIHAEVAAVLTRLWVKQLWTWWKRKMVS